MNKFKVGDVVYVANPDREYESEYCSREHRNFFGIVTEINEYPKGISVGVKFNDYLDDVEWYYSPEELDHASSLKDMTLEEFSNTFGLCVNGTYL